MPPYILALDRGPEPYRPPVHDRLARVEPTDQSAAAGAVGEREGSAPHTGGRPYFGAESPIERRPAILASQIMSAPVVTLPVQAPLDQAWAMVRDRAIRHIPILASDGRIAGIISDRDLMRGRPGPRHNPAPDRRSAGRSVGDLMSLHVIAVTSDTPIRDIARILVDERIGCVPIVNETIGLVGIVTRTDVLRCVINHAPLDLWI